MVSVHGAQDGRGRGLVSTRHLHANAIILSCPCVEDETRAFENSVAMDYVFEHPKKEGRHEEEERHETQAQAQGGPAWEKQHRRRKSEEAPE